jgi:hypothetical protein
MIGAAMKVQTLHAIRRDGRTIDETMSPADVARLGPPQKVVRIEWRHDQGAGHLEHPGGLLAKVLPDRSGIAVLLYEENAQYGIALKLLEPDGSVRASSDNRVTVDGGALLGGYGWFEPARTVPSRNIGVVFFRAADDAMMQLDIDSSTGKVVGAYKLG